MESHHLKLLIGNNYFIYTRLTTLIKLLKKSECNTIIVLIRYFINKLVGKKILAHQKTIIKGIKNINTTGLFKIGINFIGFETKKDSTLIRINGKLNVLGNVSIARGCRIAIDGEMTIGNNSYINSNCLFVIQNKLSIGSGTAISWNCQFLDDDFHNVSYEGKKLLKSNDIFIGNNVLIGNNTFVYKGTYIPDGCIIASNSVVKDTFTEPNVLIAGNPAKVIRKSVSWN